MGARGLLRRRFLCPSLSAESKSAQSLAYEVAPFNIKTTILQPNLEINVLSNKITSVPPLPQYSPDTNPAPLSREILSGLLDKLSESSDAGAHQSSSPEQSSNPDTHPRSQAAETPGNAGDALLSHKISSLYPTISPSVQSLLIAETLFAIAAVGGHDNPPARHIVGSEGVASVKEKLKTVSQELEDFVQVSGQVDIARVDNIGHTVKTVKTEG
jgi:hypothetical protein